ncbi:MAG: T9SS type A sorting domain-containing protein [Bacteroidales bacterium]|nr:T9SS type A sorting domain-containing protein [Bacteroidales bacterium]
MIRTFLFLWIFSISIYGSSQIIPDDRRTDWSIAGLAEAINEPELIINIMDLGASGDGITDDTEFLLQAIGNLNGQAGVIFFPEGDYLITSTIILPDSCIISGVDSISTQLIFNHNGQANSCFTITGQSSSDFIPVLTDLETGSTTMEIEPIEDIETGDYIELIQDNGEWDTNPISWGDNAVGQLLHITDINGSSIEFEHPLRINYSTELNPRIRKLTPKTHISIRNLKLIRQDEPLEGAGYNIQFEKAKNCQVINIESEYSVGSHIYFGTSMQCEVKDSYFHDAFTFDGTGTRGYGITLNHHTGECLIENNIFKKLRHAMMVKTGANGNVFGYNYSIEPYRSENIHDYTADISLHGHYAFSNLFEGNICQNIIIDHYWGPSGPLNTFFRNRAELYGIIVTYINIPLITSDQNFVGNEITNTNFLYGNYDIHGENHLEYGNNSPEGYLPEPINSLVDSSYYLLNKPAFWIVNYPWASIGFPYDLDEYSNPARDRYLGLLPIDIQKTKIPEISVFPNPAHNYINIKYEHLYDHMSLQLYDMKGCLIFEKQNPYQGDIIQLDLRTIPQGLYQLVISTEKNYLATSILIQ